MYNFLKNISYLGFVRHRILLFEELVLYQPADNGTINRLQDS